MAIVVGGSEALPRAEIANADAVDRAYAKAKRAASQAGRPFALAGVYGFWVAVSGPCFLVIMMFAVIVALADVMIQVFLRNSRAQLPEPARGELRAARARGIKPAP